MIEIILNSTNEKALIYSDVEMDAEKFLELFYEGKMFTVKDRYHGLVTIVPANIVTVEVR